VGTSLVTGSGAPTAALVYKLVARAESEDGPLRPVAKRSVGKPSRGGRKWAVRHIGDDGKAIAEAVSTSEQVPGPYDRSLLRPLVRDGEIIGREPLAEARARHERALTELPSHAFQLSRGDPAIPTDFGTG
jgi:nicotinate phosphoribosyltransferase